MTSYVLSQETKAKLMTVSTATLCTALFKRGLRNQFIQDVRPVSPKGRNMVGQAFTLRYIPAREDLNQIDVFRNPAHPQRAAIEACPPGQVLVMDSRKDPRAASAGGAAGLDEAVEVPPCVVALQQNRRIVERYRVEDDALGDHRERAVVDGQPIHGHRGVPFVPQHHALECHAGEDVAAEPPYRELAVEVLRGLGDRLLPQPVLEPARLRHRHTGTEQDDERQHGNREIA